MSDSDPRPFPDFDQDPDRDPAKDRDRGAPHQASEECRLAREALLQDLEAGSRSGNFHCEACAAWFAGVRRQSGALRALSRVVPDARLDGRVVAALNAGVRQERAADSLAACERLRAPDALRDLVAEGLSRAPLGAPRELDGRVAGELAGRGSARVGSQIAGLERRAVPAELAGRVAKDLAMGSRGSFARGFRALPRWTALAAGLLVAVGAISFTLRGRFGDQELGFRVVRASSVDQMSPFARDLFAGASGWVELPAQTVRIVPPGGAR